MSLSSSASKVTRLEHWQCSRWRFCTEITMIGDLCIMSYLYIISMARGFGGSFVLCSIAVIMSYMLVHWPYQFLRSFHQLFYLRTFLNYKLFIKVYQFHLYTCICLHLLNLTAISFISWSSIPGSNPAITMHLHHTPLAS